jgi:hypothetical protein
MRIETDSILPPDQTEYFNHLFNHPEWRVFRLKVFEGESRIDKRPVEIAWCRETKTALYDCGEGQIKIKAKSLGAALAEISSWPDEDDLEPED